MAPLKVYVVSVSANQKTKKDVQRTLMLLESLGVPFDAIDIAKPEHQDGRAFMRENAINPRTEGKAPLPPQFFYENEYLGNYDDFEESVEDDRMTEFLRLVPNSQWCRALRKKEREAGGSPSSDQENIPEHATPLDDKHGKASGDDEGRL